MIEPIGTPTSSATPQAGTVQPARPVTAPVPQPTASTVPPSISATSAIPSSPAEKRPSRPMGLSLKEMREGPAKPKVAAATVETKELMDAPFTEESLRQAWNQYAQGIDKEVHLKNTMINCVPHLLDAHLFEVVVHNPAQQDELLQKTLSILSFVRNQLRNAHVQLRVRIDETNQKQIAVTAAEKYALLYKINPALGKLKEEF